MKKKNRRYVIFGIALIVGGFVLLAYTNTRPETINMNGTRETSNAAMMSETELAERYWLLFSNGEVKHDVNCRLVEGIPEQPCRWLIATYWLSPN